MLALGVSQIAHVLHETNRALCSVLGDDSQASWADAPPWQKESVQLGVWDIYRNPGRTPKESHTGWMTHKRLNGWRYGPVKDAVKREHPCLVDYEALPEAQKAKDKLFVTIARILLDVTLTEENRQ